MQRILIERPIRWRVLCLLLVLAVSACTSSTPRERSRAAAKKYQLQGEVLRLDPAAHSAFIKHDEIEGWMEAMTMEFPVESEADLKKLHEGDRIEATVFVQDLDYWIGEIQITEPARK